MIKSTEPNFHIIAPKQLQINQSISWFEGKLNRLPFYQNKTISLSLEIPFSLNNESKTNDFDMFVQDDEDERQFWGTKMLSKDDPSFINDKRMFSDLPSFVFKTGLNFQIRCQVKQTWETPDTIFVKLKTGKTVVVYCNLKNDTVYDIKQKLVMKEGVGEYANSRLIHGGHVLEDKHLLSEYHIFKESTIHDVMRLRGGMYDISSGRKDFISINPNHKDFSTSKICVKFSQYDELVFIPCNIYISIEKLLLFLRLLISPKREASFLTKDQAHDLLMNETDNLNPTVIDELIDITSSPN